MKSKASSEKPTHSLSQSFVARLPLVGFALCVIAGWIGMWLDQWWWAGIGIVVGFVVGDLLEALKPDPPSSSDKP